MSSLKAAYFFLLMALISYLAPRHTILFLKAIVDDYSVSFAPFSSLSLTQDIAGHRHYGLRHHRSHNRNKANNGTGANVCDDFPPDFPPPDTNTTAILCVDRNGCCNFTTVQSAVNAAPTLSQKRIVIWINSGIY
ncbi:hypothetical protein Ancab_002858 [Ancistrocladus abbreviatus]